MHKKAIKTIVTLLFITVLLSGCGTSYTDKEIADLKEDAYAEGYEAGLEDSKAETYSEIAEEEGFERIDEYLGSNEQYNYVYITPTSHCYHCIDCESLQNTAYVKAYSLGDTPEEYTECPYCRPYQYE